jgi:hypothetical protein
MQTQRVELVARSRSEGLHCAMGRRPHHPDREIIRSRQNLANMTAPSHPWYSRQLSLIDADYVIHVPLVTLLVYIFKKQNLTRMLQVRVN